MAAVSIAYASAVGRVHHLLDLAAAGVHVHAARQARVERAYRPHDVDPLEVLGSVLLEDRRVLHRVLVGSGRPVDVARARVPRRRRVGLVVGDLALLDHHVVREHAARGLVEAAADRALGNLEAVPALGPARLDLLHRALEVVQRDQRAVGLVVGAGAVALDRVGLLRHVPLELHLGHVRGARQHHLDRVAGRLRVAEVDQAGLGRAPLTGERAAAGVTAHVRVGPLVVDPRRHDPGVLVGEVALLRTRQRDLVPRVVLVDRVAERVVGDERRLVLPPVEVRGAEQDPDHQVDLDEVGGDQLAADRHAGGDVALAAPVRSCSGSRSRRSPDRRTSPS